MAKKNPFGSVKRYGARYGATTRRRAGIIEAGYRNIRLNCPYCGKKNVKRSSLGIWECAKCNSRFTGRAYELSGTKTQEQPTEAKS